MHTETELSDYRDKDGRRSSFSREIKLSSDETLVGAERIKSEQIGETLYVAYQYDQRSLLDKLLSALPAGNDSISDNSKALASLPISGEIRKRGKNPKFRVLHKNGYWNVSTESGEYSVNPQEWFNGFFLESTSEAVSIIIQPKSSIKHGDQYTIAIEQRNTGFLSLFNVLENGQVFSLGKVNQKNGNGLFTYPDLEKYSGLIAENLTGYDTTRDVIFAVSCRKPEVAFSVYEKIREEEADNTDERFFTYGKFLEDISPCEWSSIFLYITK